MDGVLVICKEKGYTSHDVVAKLRGILHMKKIGHTGTLDPDAEGVLPVVLGKATKLADMLTEKEKTYEAVLHLGIVTDTQDMTGTVLFEAQPEEDEEKTTRQNARTDSVLDTTCFWVGHVTFLISETIPLKKEAILVPVLLKKFGFFAFFSFSFAIKTHP